jgi:hypothetical protein
VWALCVKRGRSGEDIPALRVEAESGGEVVQVRGPDSEHACPPGKESARGGSVRTLETLESVDVRALSRAGAAGAWPRGVRTRAARYR